MIDKEPDDAISRKRQSMDEYARQVAYAKYRRQVDRKKNRNKCEQRKDRRESWGFVVAVIVCVATVIGVLYAIFGR